MLLACFVEGVFRLSIEGFSELALLQSLTCFKRNQDRIETSTGGVFLLLFVFTSDASSCFQRFACFACQVDRQRSDHHLGCELPNGLSTGGSRGPEGVGGEKIRGSGLRSFFFSLNKYFVCFLLEGFCVFLLEFLFWMALDLLYGWVCGCPNRMLTPK